MKTKINLFGMCFDWRVLLGLAAIGIGIAVFAPQLLSLNLVYLLAVLACPLSMLLMMNMMGQAKEKEPSSTANLGQRQVAGIDGAASSPEQIAQLRAQLQSLQEQQRRVADQIDALEQSEQQQQAEQQ